ncbi:hypothetical protein HYS50_00160 [Candidatus Woesearchaeota archaeon]|nr:hypothetical protein [Candidatus Woesearchaeota archaeon]
MNSARINTIIGISIGVLVVFSLLNIYLLQTRYTKVAEAEVIAQEIMRPAVIQVIKLTTNECEDCFDIEKAVTAVKNQNVNITEETLLDGGSQEAQELVKKYNIAKLPTLVIQGELNKSESLMKFYENNGVVIDANTSIYTNIQPPYYDVQQGKVIGHVVVLNIIDASCKQCISLEQVENALTKAGVRVVKTAPYEYDSNEGQELIAEYGVTRIPAMLIAQEIDVYEVIKKDIQTLAGNAKNGFYAIHSQLPPYRDLQKNAVVGLVDLIELTDKSCTTCYDVKTNEQILQRFGIVLNKINELDVSAQEGQDLIAKYTITKVPMIIVSPEVAVYPSFDQVWQSVGAVEDDGFYVMRNPQLLGTYKDLTTNKVVAAQNA